ncbi:MAG: hypothetical protein HYT89_03740 [Candidatus Omnitrophica bacterium]|nr:hypothetical protein [Candidatus Omnitrophota bacterium]
MSAPGSGPLVILQASGFFVLFCLAFFSTGRVVLGDYWGVSERPSVALLNLLCSVAIGLFLFSLWMIFFGALGWWHAWAVYAFLGVGISLLILRRRETGEDLGPLFRTETYALSRWEWAIVLFFTILAGVTFIAAQAPVIGNDALVYHLYFPRWYVETGGFVYEPTHARSLWPSFIGMAYTAALLVQGTALATLFSWLAAPLTAGLTFLTGIYLFRDRAVSFLALGLFLATPVVWMQSVYPYTDNAVMLYLFLSYLAAWIWKIRGYGFKDAFILGLFLAALVSAKIFGLIPAVLLAALHLWGMLRSRSVSWRKKSLSSFLAVVVCLVFSGFWYGRSYILTGNPVFPFLSAWFGSGFEQHMVGFHILPKTLLNLLLLPWNLAYRVDVFGGEPLGALPLMVLPLCFFFLDFKKNERVRWMMFFTTALAIAWYYSIQHVRFLIPALPYGCLLAALALRRWREKPDFLKKITTVVLVFAACAHYALSAYYPLKFWKPALGLIPADDYLIKNERSFAVLAKIRPHLKPGEKILFLNEPRLFYAPAGTVCLDNTVLWMCRQRGISLIDWIRESRFRYLLAWDKDPAKLDWKPYLGPEGALELRSRELATDRVTTPEESLYFKLWEIF